MLQELRSKHKQEIVDLLESKFGILSDAERGRAAELFDKWRAESEIIHLQSDDQKTEVFSFATKTPRVGKRNLVYRFDGHGLAEHYTHCGIRKLKRGEILDQATLQNALLSGDRSYFCGSFDGKLDTLGSIDVSLDKSLIDTGFELYRGLVGSLYGHRRQGGVALTPDEKTNIKIFFKRINSEEQEAFIERLQSRINTDLLDMLERFDLVDLKDYIWFDHADPIISRNRQQAARSYPALSVYFRNTDKFGDFTGTGPIIEAIDRGKEIKPLLRERFAGAGQQVLPPVFTKWLQRFDRPLPNLPDSLWDLKTIPFEKFPQDMSSYIDYQTCQRVATNIDHSLGVPAKAALSEFSKDWRAAALWAHKWKVQDTQDYRRAIYKVLVLPRIVHLGLGQRCGFDRPYALNDFSSQIMPGLLKMSLRELYDMDQRWHSQTEHFSDAIVSQQFKDDQRWLPLTDPVTAPNGVHLRCLTTSEDLKTQGKLQKHCVGDYTASCLQNSHIVSLWSGTDQWKPYSTAQLSERRRSGHNKEMQYVELVQHQGYQRSNPEARAEAALAWYIEQINENILKPDWDAIDARRKSEFGKIVQTRMLREIGFDPMDMQACENAFEIAKHFLNRRCRYMSYQQWIEESGVDTFIREALMPKTKQSLLPE